MQNIKKCNQCEIIKDITEFYPRRKQGTTTSSSYCKECSKNRLKEQTYKFKQKCLEYKNSKGCLNCNYNDHQSALEFHHIISEEKDFSIAQYSKYASKELPQDVKDELDKCIVLCANCHRKIHNDALKFENNKFYEINSETFSWKYMEDKPKHFSKESLEKLINQNLNINEISKQLNLSKSGINYWLKKYYLKTNFKRGMKTYNTNCIHCNKELNDGKLYCSNTCKNKYHYLKNKE